MFLATLFVSMDLDPEVPTVDREKVLRSLRDKLRQFFTHRISVRTDDDAALFVSLFDESFERAKSRIEDVLEKIEHTGEARVADHFAQVFEWFDGHFVETREELDVNELVGDGKGSLMRRPNEAGQSKMIVYKEDEEDDDMSPLPTRFNRRTMRIPTRK